MKPNLHLDPSPARADGRTKATKSPRATRRRGKPAPVALQEQSLALQGISATEPAAETQRTGVRSDAVQQHSGLYVPTGIAPETLFQQIGRLRKEAQDEVDRLLAFLDATDDPDLEDDETESDPDREPSLGAQEPGMFNVDQSRWGNGPIDDREDEHDGREPLGDDEPSLCGLGVGGGNDQDLENDRADDEPTLGSFDGLVDQEKSWLQRPVWVQDGELNVLDDDRPIGPRQATEGHADA